MGGWRSLLRPLVRKFYRHTSPYHRPVRFWDGSVYSCRGEVWLLFRLWRSAHTLVAESNKVFDSYSGGDFLDVGSYHGWYAALLSPKAKPGDTFLLIEPDPRALTMLYTVVAELSRVFPHVRYAILSCAAGNGEHVRFTYPYGQEGHPRVESCAMVDSQQVSIRLDDIVPVMALEPALIKIDVEGAEMHVLQGSAAILRDLAPRMMLEIHPQWQPDGLTVQEIEQFLIGLEYTAEDIDVSTDSARRQIWSRHRSTVG